jgi:hypothetical protein
MEVIMSDLILSNNQSDSPFDSIRRFDDKGNEFWYARELMPLLQYKKWQAFGGKQENRVSVVEKAKLSCKNAGNNPDLHFTQVSNQVKRTNNGIHEVDDWKLSRFACYLIAQNGDPTKEAIAQAQTYFAIKTREAETVIPQQSDRIRELELELELTRAKQKLIDTRNIIVKTCPEPVQQRILGYEVVEVEKKTVYRESELIRDGSTVSKTELCRRYGFINPKSGKPDYKKLNKYLTLSGVGTGCGEHNPYWDYTHQIREGEEFKSEFLPELDRLLMSDRIERQVYLGESK